MKHVKSKIFILVILVLIILCTGCYGTKREKLAEKYSDKKITTIVREYLKDKYGNSEELNINSIERYEVLYTVIDATQLSVFKGFEADCGDYSVYVDFTDDGDYVVTDTKQYSEINDEIQRRYDKYVSVDGCATLSIANDTTADIRGRHSFKAKFNGDLGSFFKEEQEQKDKDSVIGINVIVGNQTDDELIDELEKELKEFKLEGSDIVCYISKADTNEIKREIHKSNGVYTEKIEELIYNAKGNFIANFYLK